MKLIKLISFIITFCWITNLSAQPLNLVTSTLPPFAYMEDEKLKGVAVKIVKMVFKEMKQDISIEVMPWARAILYVKEGKRDAIFTAYKNPIREKFSDYSKEVLIP